MNAVVELARAFDFAARRHTGQRRKGAAAEPYVNHVAEVAALVAHATEGGDLPLVLAALLHDTVEDTGTTADEIAALFGAEVASLVLEVTDDKRLPRAERKRRQVEAAAGKSARARLLKVADKTSNLRSLAASAPVGWDAKLRQDYVAWARDVVASCRGLSAWLEAEFDAACADAERLVGGGSAEGSA